MSSGKKQQTDEFDKQGIEELLTALNDKLAEKEMYGEIYVVGGAALVLEYGSERVTGDIDCSIQQEPDAVHTAAREIANERPELPSDWLNETAAVAHKVPEDIDDAAVVSFKGSHLTVRTASPERLIAMKMHAGREHDYKDLERLLKLTAIRNGKEAKMLTEYHFPHTTITENTVERIDKIIRNTTETQEESRSKLQKPAKLFSASKMDHSNIATGSSGVADTKPDGKGPERGTRRTKR